MQNFKKADHQMNGAGIQFEPLQPLSDDFILDQRQVFFIFIS